MAIRARTSAEFSRYASTRLVGLREIDREATKVDPATEQLEKSMIRTAQMGSRLAKGAIAAYNQDVDSRCNYCLQEKSTVNHIRWECNHFDDKRKEVDPELASVISKGYLLDCIKCGVALAMHTDGNKTYWGRFSTQRKTRL